MTRYTNVARKRTYVEAGFSYRDDPTEARSELQDGEPENRADAGIVKAEKKKQKRIRSGHQEGEAQDASGTDHPAPPQAGPSEQPEAEKEGDHANRASFRGKEDVKKSSAKARRLRDAEGRKAASERRRIQRIQERHAETVCYACREKGHAARDCPKDVGSSDNKQGKSAVGICYRCGSSKHNLSKCRERVDPSNPLPFASCFVCSSRGHLASACPQNQGKGVYPNGGCCKLCGETTHLAKDCTLRKNDAAKSAVFLGTGHDAGADEDDFHTFKRRNAKVDRAEKAEERLKRQVNVKVGAHTGVLKSFGKAPAVKKKVVSF